MGTAPQLNDGKNGQFHGGIRVRIETPHAFLVKTLPAPQAPEHKDFHYHEYPFFWTLVDGSATEKLANRRERAYRQMVPVFTPAGEVHAHSSNGRTAVGLGLIIRPDMLDSVKKIEPMEMLDPESVATMERLNAEAETRDEASGLAIEGLTLELLAKALRYSVSPKDQRAPDWLKTARDLLHDRHREKLRIGEIAHSVGIHPVHLSTEFRRYFGTTPGQYLRTVRLHSAAGLLERTDSTIGVIATDLGFYDEAHFAHAFKEALGVTPTEYRRGKQSL